MKGNFDRKSIRVRLYSLSAVFIITSIFLAGVYIYTEHQRQSLSTERLRQEKLHSLKEIIHKNVLHAYTDLINYDFDHSEVSFQKVLQELNNSIDKMNQTLPLLPRTDVLQAASKITNEMIKLRDTAVSTNEIVTKIGTDINSDLLGQSRKHAHALEASLTALPDVLKNKQVAIADTPLYPEPTQTEISVFSYTEQIESQTEKQIVTPETPNYKDAALLSLLQMRRHEKDFLARKTIEHRQKHQNEHQNLTLIIDSLSVDTSQKDTLTSELNLYFDSFTQLADAVVIRARLTLASRIIMQTTLKATRT